MIIRKEWAMPNSKTFRIKPIRELILNYAKPDFTIVDPFANECSIVEHLPCTVKYISNDLDTQYNTTYNMDAVEFLKQLPDCSADMVLYDPPYSPNQLKECYEQLGLSVTAQDVRTDNWTSYKEQIARITKPGGICISFMWNTNGIGKCFDFEQEEILLVCHGGGHNDTLCTVERKNRNIKTELF